MLKLEPISLVLKAGMASLPDTFGEKIKANYEIMAASFTPKDLLFLLTNPPEIPMMDGGLTSLVTANSVQNTQNVIIDIVNNIANRVLLEDKSELTYQDRVYIDIALRKLGIENVALFMEQVRTLYNENQSIYKLSTLYRDNFNALTEKISTLTGDTRKTQEIAATDATDMAEREHRLFIHEEIYKRLGTAEIYNKIFKIAGGFSERVTEINSYEIRAAEQRRSADVLTLNEYRSRLFEYDGPQLTYYRNHYELGDILPSPSTEEKVISQAVSAALLQFIDNVMVTRMSAGRSDGDTWLDIKNAVQYSALNSISRFIEFHEDRKAALYQSIYDIALLTTLYKTEAAAVTSYIDSVSILEHRAAAREEAFDEPRRERERYALQTRLMPLSRELIREINTVHEAQKTILKAGEHVTALREHGHTETSLERLTRISPQSFTEIDIHGGTAQTSFTNENYSGDTTILTHTGDTYEQREPDTERVHETERAEHEKLLRESLKEIDRQNRERLEHLSELQSRIIETPAPRAPDRKRILRDALRAIENPEAAIAAAMAEELQTEPRLPPQAELLLSQTDETTRRLFETVQLVSRDPESAERAGIRVEREPTALIADIAEIEKQRLEHVREIRREIIETEAASAAATDYSRLEGGGVYKPESERPAVSWESAVPIVHRTTATADYEELLRTQERRQTERVEQTETREAFNETHTAQTQVNQVTQDIISKTTEDVTELINKTLMRQIGTISDRVYTQLEKRLQSERSRRGRF